MKRLRLAIAGSGCLLSLTSALLLLFIFGFSTLSGGEFPEGRAPWWGAVLGTMFRSPDPGTVTYACIAALAFGIYLCFRRSGIRMTIGRMMVWVAIIALVLGLLTWSASQEQVTSIESLPRPDGSKLLIYQYANWFGPTRVVQRIER